jgi:VanZ family protein
MPKSNVHDVSWLNIPNKDKLVHFTLFFIWAFLLNIDLKKYKLSFKSNMALVMSLCLILAAFTEFFQPIFSDRTTEALDVLADMLGASFGLWFITYIHRRFSL